MNLNICSNAVIGMAFLTVLWPSINTAQTATSSKTPASYQYDTVGVHLEGILTQLKEYGPPGYGETPSKDERDKILVLRLLNPISVYPTANAEASGSASLDAVKNVREVQLFISQPQLVDARKLLGKPVVAIGTLNEAAAPSQYTKVWLNCQSVSSK